MLACALCAQASIATRSVIDPAARRARREGPAFEPCAQGGISRSERVTVCPVGVLQGMQGTHAGIVRRREYRPAAHTSEA